jgi:hypothetical protein
MIGESIPASFLNVWLNKLMRFHRASFPYRKRYGSIEKASAIFKIGMHRLATAERLRLSQVERRLEDTYPKESPRTPRFSKKSYRAKEPFGAFFITRKTA